MKQDKGPVVVAVESSQGSDEAIRQGDSRVRVDGGKVVYCAAFPDLTQLDELLLPRLAASDVTPVRERIASEVRERVAALTGQAADTVEVCVLAGIPHEAIIREAERLDARLIVVGASARPGLFASLRGSIAERTVRYANLPVLVARPRPLTGIVLAATNFADEDLPALAAAAQESRRIQGKLLAVHCIDLEQLQWINGSFTATQGWIDLSERSVASLREEARARLEAALSKIGAEGTAMVVSGDPAPAILGAAAEAGAEIIVVGTAGRKGLERMTMGSVAEMVVRNATTSVLVVRLDEAFENA